MSGDSSINVVVVTHNSTYVLPECLASLPVGFADVGSYRLTIVDNASSDGTVELATELAPDASVLELGRNAGYAAAINAAMSKQPPADHTLVLNPDIRLHAGSVSALVNAVRRPGVGIAVPKMLDERGALQHSLRREPTVLRAVAEAVIGGRRASRHRAIGEVVGRAEQYDFEQATTWATGAAMLISRACSDAVGAWDESFFLYSEETDFCLRARDAGLLTWYTPAACVTHLGGESNTSPQLWSRLTANRIRLYAKRHGRASTAAFRIAVVLNEGIRAAIGRDVHRAGLSQLVRSDSVRSRHGDPRSAQREGTR